MGLIHNFPTGYKLQLKGNMLDQAAYQLHLQISVTLNCLLFLKKRSRRPTRKGDPHGKYLLRLNSPPVPVITQLRRDGSVLRCCRIVPPKLFCALVMRPLPRAYCSRRSTPCLLLLGRRRCREAGVDPPGWQLCPSDTVAAQHQLLHPAWVGLAPRCWPGSPVRFRHTLE